MLDEILHQYFDFKLHAGTMTIKGTCKSTHVSENKYACGCEDIIGCIHKGLGVKVPKGAVV